MKTLYQSDTLIVGRIERRFGRGAARKNISLTRRDAKSPWVMVEGSAPVDTPQILEWVERLVGLNGVWTVVVTHNHPDHLDQQMVRFLDQRHWVRTFTPLGDTRRFCAPVLMAQEFSEIRHWMSVWHAPSAYFDRLFRVSNRWPFTNPTVARVLRSDWMVHAITEWGYGASKAVLPFDQIPSDGAEQSVEHLMMIPSPGHTLEEVVFWDEERRRLFTGDGIQLVEYPGNLLWAAYASLMLTGCAKCALNSMTQAKQLGPRSLIPAHGTFLMNGAQTIYNALLLGEDILYHLIQEARNYDPFNPQAFQRVLRDRGQRGIRSDHGSELEEICNIAAILRAGHGMTAPLCPVSH